MFVINMTRYKPSHYNGSRLTNQRSDCINKYDKRKYIPLNPVTNNTIALMKTSFEYFDVFLIFFYQFLA